MAHKTEGFHKNDPIFHKGHPGHEKSVDRATGHPGHTNVEGAKRYADPEDKAYPLDTPEHRHAAASLFGMHKDKYSPAKRAEIAHNIAKS